MSDYDLNLFLTIAKSQIGKHEVGSSNSGPDVIPYQRATNLAGTGWPWCAAFVDWVIREYCTKTGSGLTEKEDSWRPKTASAFGELEWGRSHGCIVKNRNQLAKAGDIVVFSFSHVGFVIEDQKSVGDNIVTIEGNTSASGSRDGGSVWKKSRSVSTVKGYVTWLPFVPKDSGTVKSVAPTEDVSAKPQVAQDTSKYESSVSKIRDILSKVIKAKSVPNPAYDLDEMLQILPVFCMLNGIVPGPRLDYFLTNIMFETGNLRVVAEEGDDKYLSYLENRPELGNNDPGDGIKYKGRGLLQTTGKENYVNYGVLLGADLVNHPQWLENTTLACAVPVLYWANRKLNALADQKLFADVVRKVKGSLSDVDKRRDLLHEIREIINR